MSEQKWQRITYMPATPIGEHGERVTGSKKHIALSRRAAREGMVLLKNEGRLLPFAKDAKLAVFGKAQVDYVKGGGGSGDTTVAYTRSILDGLEEKEQEGRLSLFAPLSEFYRADVAAQQDKGAHCGKTVEPALPAELVKAARAFTDTALITICRFSGEGWDRTGEAFDGDFFLSREEMAMVDAVRSTFPRVAVVLNTGGMMDSSWFRGDDRISAALLAWQGGMEGGSATADVLCGDECPSGHLTDTFAVDFAAYPSSAGFNDSEDYVEYRDDIYVGYRYFETVAGAADKVCYPFGYGLSYTSFAFTDACWTALDTDFTVQVKVTNTGDVAGRQVAQVYCEAPQGKLGKPHRVLVGFAKTGKLKPGESQRLTLHFTARDFASYDDLGKVQASAWLLEKGDYRFYLGDNVRDAAAFGEKWTLDDTLVVEQCTRKCAPSQLPERMLADGSFEKLPEMPVPERFKEDWDILPEDGASPKDFPNSYRKIFWRPDDDTPTLKDVYDGKLTLDVFMDTLTDEEMVHLLGGQPNHGVGNTFGWGNLPKRGIPSAMTADGPAGLRIWPECGVNTTAFPCATMLCCTWDPELLYEVGKAAALEVHENGIGIWLAPAINIHRSPLCGRNFEYYAEDPLLAGQLSAALIRGIQSEGVACSLKHFACNNKETNRRNSDSRVSERALREIYLTAFEICVKTAQPWSIMSSYNLINGRRASENDELLTGILRDEWGFDGMVTTDWYTFGEQWREIEAGNDMKMGAGMPEHTLKMLQEGKLSREALRTSVKRLLTLLLRLK